MTYHEGKFLTESSEHFSETEPEADIDQLHLAKQNPTFPDDSFNEEFIFGEKISKYGLQKANLRFGEDLEFDDEPAEEDAEKILDKEFGSEKMKDLFKLVSDWEIIGKLALFRKIKNKCFYVKDS